MGESVMLTIVSLCDLSGNWSKPYRDAGYDVMQVDIKHGQDVRLFERLPFQIRGVLAAPPCTDFASSGAQYWDAKGEKALLDALAVVDACCRIVLMHRPLWWAIENPIGRLSRWLGEPKLVFQPNEYGDPYTKRTCIWGEFKTPRRQLVLATEGSKMVRYSEHDPDRQMKRSLTPLGFAQAFFEANP